MIVIYTFFTHSYTAILTLQCIHFIEYKSCVLFQGKNFGSYNFRMHSYFTSIYIMFANLQTAKLKVEVLSHDGEVKEMKGNCVWRALLLLRLAPKNNFFSEQREVRLVGKKA